MTDDPSDPDSFAFFEANRAYARTVPIDSDLPCYAGKAGGEPEHFQMLQGSTIVAIGSPAESDPEGRWMEGGGLVIEYRRPGSDEVLRLALGFNECGMWVEYHGPLVLPPGVTHQEVVRRTIGSR